VRDSLHRFGEPAPWRIPAQGVMSNAAGQIRDAAALLLIVAIPCVLLLAPIPVSVLAHLGWAALMAVVGKRAAEALSRIMPDIPYSVRFFIAVVAVAVALDLGGFSLLGPVTTRSLAASTVWIFGVLVPSYAHRLAYPRDRASWLFRLWRRWRGDSD